MFVMGVTYELIDAPYPYLCAVYRCVCGGVQVQHGDEEQFLCPGCAAEARRRAAAADPHQAE
jgi:hypothetical protein